MTSPWLSMQYAGCRQAEIEAEVARCRLAAQVRRDKRASRPSPVRRWAGRRIIRVGLAVSGRGAFEPQLPFRSLAG
jgi:hypothetical protein